jgi:hypothetical protein
METPLLYSIANTPAGDWMTGVMLLIFVAFVLMGVRGIWKIRK